MADYQDQWDQQDMQDYIDQAGTQMGQPTAMQQSMGLPTSLGTPQQQQAGMGAAMGLAQNFPAPAQPPGPPPSPLDHLSQVADFSGGQPPADPRLLQGPLGMAAGPSIGDAAGSTLERLRQGDKVPQTGGQTTSFWDSVPGDSATGKALSLFGGTALAPLRLVQLGLMKPLQRIMGNQQVLSQDARERLGPTGLMLTDLTANPAHMVPLAQNLNLVDKVFPAGSPERAQLEAIYARTGAGSQSDTASGSPGNVTSGAAAAPQSHRNMIETLLNIDTPQQAAARRLGDVVQQYDAQRSMAVAMAKQQAEALHPLFEAGRAYQVGQARQELAYPTAFAETQRGLQEQAQAGATTAKLPLEESEIRARTGQAGAAADLSQAHADFVRGAQTDEERARQLNTLTEAMNRANMPIKDQLGLLKQGSQQLQQDARQKTAAVQKILTDKTMTADQKDQLLQQQGLQPDRDYTVTGSTGATATLGRMVGAVGPKGIQPVWDITDANRFYQHMGGQHIEAQQKFLTDEAKKNKVELPPGLLSAAMNAGSQALAGAAGKKKQLTQQGSAPPAPEDQGIDANTMAYWSKQTQGKLDYSSLASFKATASRLNVPLPVAQAMWAEHAASTGQ